MLKMPQSLTFRKAQVRYSPGPAVHNGMEPRMHCNRKLDLDFLDLDFLDFLDLDFLAEEALYWLRGKRGVIPWIWDPKLRNSPTSKLAS